MEEKRIKPTIFLDCKDAKDFVLWALNTLYSQKDFDKVSIKVLAHDLPDRQLKEINKYATTVNNLEVIYDNEAYIDNTTLDNMQCYVSCKDVIEWPDEYVLSKLINNIC